MLDQCIISCPNDGTQKIPIFFVQYLNDWLVLQWFLLTEPINHCLQALLVWLVYYNVLIVPLNFPLVHCDFAAWFVVFDDSLYLSLYFQLLGNISEEWSWNKYMYRRQWAYCFIFLEECLIFLWNLLLKIWNLRNTTP